MSRHPEKFDQDKQARQPDQAHYPHHGERIRDQNPRHEGPRRERDAGDEEE